MALSLPLQRTVSLLRIPFGTAQVIFSGQHGAGTTTFDSTQPLPPGPCGERLLLPVPSKQTQSDEAGGEERESARQRCYNGSKGEASVCTEDDPICVTAEPGRSTVTGRVEK